MSIGQIMVLVFIVMDMAGTIAIMEYFPIQMRTKTKTKTEILTETLNQTIK